MKIMFFCWHSPETATAVPVDEPPVIMTAPSRSIMRCAFSVATPGLV